MEHSQTENIYVPRNTQIDSKYLDNEVFILLKETLSSAFTYTGQNVLVKLEPEFEAALKLSLYHLTIGKHKQTVGQQLMRVKYDDRNSPKKMKYYYLCLILGSWLKQRVPFLVSLKRNDVKSVALKFCDLFETTYQVLDIFNLMLFLVKGKYPSLIERVFCLKVIPSTEDSVQKLSYAYFTRELLWNGFADLLATLLPLIPAKQFHNFIRQFLPSFVTHASSNSAEEEEKNVSSKVETICTICNDLAILPHKFGCNHVACYYCIHSAIVVTSYRCSLCGTRADYSQIIPLAL